MAHTDEPPDAAKDRRTAIKMREVVELVIVELRELGMTEELIDAIRKLHAGFAAYSRPVAETIRQYTLQDLHPNGANRDHLTRREMQVLRLVASGKVNKEIGIELGISPRTVEIYRSRLLRKFNVPSTPELIEKLLS